MLQTCQSAPCVAQFTPRDRARYGGRPQLYCSAKCRGRAERRRHYALHGPLSKRQGQAVRHATDEELLRGLP